MELSDASEKIPSDTTGDRTQDLPTSSYPRPSYIYYIYIYTHTHTNKHTHTHILLLVAGDPHPTYEQRWIYLWTALFYKPNRELNTHFGSFIGDGNFVPSYKLCPLNIFLALYACDLKESLNLDRVIILKWYGNSCLSETAYFSTQSQ